MTNYFEQHIATNLEKMRLSGELEKTPYRVKKIDYSDYFRAPKETRSTNRVLVDSGFKPPKLELLSQIKEKERMRALSTCENEQKSLKQEIISLRLKYDVLR